MLKDSALNLLPALVITIIAGRILGWRRVAEERTKDSLRQVSLIAAICYAMTIILTGVLGLRHSPTWTMPVFPFVAVVLAAFVRSPDWDHVFKLRLWGLASLAGLALAAPIVLYITFVSGLASAVDPRRELGQTAVQLWKETRNDNLRVVGGDYYTALSASLEAKNGPRVWQFHDKASSTFSYVKKHGALLICRDNDAPCQQKSDALLRRVGGWRCEVNVFRTLLGSRSPIVRAGVYVVAAAKQRMLLRPPAVQACVHVFAVKSPA
jgi:hypothetical protein